MWDGYFDEIMKSMNPINGKWTGLAYYYNLYEGWHEYSPWLIPNNLVVLEQLKLIDEDKLSIVAKEILEEMIDLIKTNTTKKIMIDYS